MREKLIDIVEAYVDFLDWDTKEDMVDSIMEFLATDNNVGHKWISVKDRLPEGDKVVLCYKADRGIRFGKILDATYADGIQAFMDRDRDFAFGVTHWMPLPQPPKGE